MARTFIYWTLPLQPIWATFRDTHLLYEIAQSKYRALLRRKTPPCKETGQPATPHPVRQGSTLQAFHQTNKFSTILDYLSKFVLFCFFRGTLKLLALILLLFQFVHAGCKSLDLAVRTTPSDLPS